MKECTQYLATCAWIIVFDAIALLVMEIKAPVRQIVLLRDPDEQ